MPYDLPNNYLRNNKKMSPCYLRGYQHFYYANLDVPINDTDFDNWVVDLYQGANQIAANIGTLTKDVVTDGFRFYTTIIIPEIVNIGFYDIVIYNSVTEDVRYVISCVQVISIDEVDKFVLLYYRNSTNIFGYNYEGIEGYNNVFLPMSVIDQQPEIEIKGYREGSTGRWRNQRSETSKVISLEGYFFDEGANDMMLALSVHDDIQINEKVVSVKTAYKVERNIKNSVNKGVIELYDQEFSIVNLNG